MNFLPKALLQQVLSHIPYGKAINEKLRAKNVAKPVPFSTIDQCVKQISILDSFGYRLSGKTVLELGPGWKPTFSLIYRLMGADKVIMIDLNPLMTKELFFSSLHDLEANKDKIIDKLRASGLSVETYQNNFEKLTSDITGNEDIKSILSKIGLEYFAPFDARNTGFEDNSIDVFFSRTVLEHIDKETLRQIFNEARRIIKPDGCMIHLVDVEDHWSYFDKSIGPLNFLRYSKLKWGLINSPIAYQNRLRASEYLTLAENADFKNEKTIFNKLSLANQEIEKIRSKMAPEFLNFTNEDLSVASFYLLARKR